jgi:hypothetical protein
MSIKLVLILILIVILSLLLFVSPGICRAADESGSYSIYFMDEKVGYEEFVWRAVSSGYELEVMGQMTKPVSMHIEHLVIQLTEDFIPLHYEFKGSLSGSEQYVSSSISDGSVFTLLPGEEDESLLLMEIGAAVIELETDKGGTLKSLHNSFQNIRVVLD